MPIAATGGNQSGGQFLEVDGLPAGSLQSFAGGDATADVVIEAVGADGIAHKHLDNVKYQDISITCGAGMANNFYDWLQQTLDRRSSRKNGAIVTCDLSGNEISRLNFFNAVVTEIGFPTLDASSQNLAMTNIKLTPEYTTKSAGNSSMARASINSKKWLISNFRLQIDGLDFSSTSRIEAITVSQSVVKNSVGEKRDNQVEAGYLVVPDLTVTLADDQRAAALYDWFESFVIRGNSGQDQEKNGTLQYLSSDLKTTFFTLDLKQLGIFRISQLTGPTSQAIRRIQITMYCEQMSFRYGSTAAGASPQPGNSPSDGQTSANQNKMAAPAGQASTNISLPKRSGLTPVPGPRSFPPQQEQVTPPSLQGPRTMPSLRFRA